MLTDRDNSKPGPVGACEGLGGCTKDGREESTVVARRTRNSDSYSSYINTLNTFALRAVIDVLELNLDVTEGLGSPVTDTIRVEKHLSALKGELGFEEKIHAKAADALIFGTLYLLNRSKVFRDLVLKRISNIASNNKAFLFGRGVFGLGVARLLRGTGAGVIPPKINRSFK